MNHLARFFENLEVIWLSFFFQTAVAVMGVAAQLGDYFQGTMFFMTLVRNQTALEPNWPNAKAKEEKDGKVMPDEAFIYFCMVLCPRNAHESKKGCFLSKLSTSSSEQPKNQRPDGIYSPYCMLILLVFIWSVILLGVLDYPP